MDELAEILRPSWGSEQWILEGWNIISAEEKAIIKGRIDELFCDGLPFELKHPKVLYIYAFSLLAQLEVLAIQVPLKFESRMSTPEHRAAMRQQLLDEIFHGLVFTKILYMLCEPHARPPAYNENIEITCNFIRSEECPKVAIMLLNLIGEGWIEEIFYSFERQQIAPKVFAKIIEDEHRHVCEADLYRDIGMPALEEVQPKLAYLEEQLLMNIFSQYKYMFSVCTLLGPKGTTEFTQALQRKHQQQLQKINLEPSENWKFYVKFTNDLSPRIQDFTKAHLEVPMSPIRKVFLTQWNDPGDPTMVGQFDIDVSAIDFFSKKYPPETITTLMLQTISIGLAENDPFRIFLSMKRLYQAEKAYTGLIVKLPDCGDQIGMIVFENCHLMTLRELALRIRSAMRMMVYCYQKRAQLEEMYPELLEYSETYLYSLFNDSYGYPVPGMPVVSLSNIGFCGYTQSKSPLRRNEAMKFTLMEVQRKPVWDNETNQFKPRDMLPVSISADHRIFDGNLPIPRVTVDYFNKMFSKMLEEQELPVTKTDPELESQLAKAVEKMIIRSPDTAYAVLYGLQTYWLDFVSMHELFNHPLLKEAADYYS
ncbi:2-oxo acid dehydrogenase subunit E2 [Legionella dresdenensis]|uniref:2-oxo acid dehydrogenase subunit E2 n=1 Tax=Legionella dresdenensis TaxID=450200 RepID=A0ABV8CD47_9GAMM